MGVILAVAFVLLAQDATAAPLPSLHQRATLGSADDSTATTWKRGTTLFPEDAAGFYRFRDRQQGIQIVSRGGEVSGYLLKFGEGETDKGLVLGYEFAQVAGYREQLWFTTRQVHGIWYGFEGQLVPQAGLSQFSTGYYVLEGALTMHDESRQTTRQASISLPSAAIKH